MQEMQFNNLLVIPYAHLNQVNKLHYETKNTQAKFHIFLPVNPNEEKWR